MESGEVDSWGGMMCDNCDKLIRQVNALIESCYYRTKSGKVHWKQGTFYGTSTYDCTHPEAFEQAIAAIRHNAGIDEIILDDNACEWPGIGQCKDCCQAIRRGIIQLQAACKFCRRTLTDDAE